MQITAPIITLFSLLFLLFSVVVLHSLCFCVQQCLLSGWSIVSLKLYFF